jgi:hypothetical protein
LRLDFHRAHDRRGVRIDLYQVVLDRIFVVEEQVEPAAVVGFHVRQERELEGSKPGHDADRPQAAISQELAEPEPLGTGVVDRQDLSRRQGVDHAKGLRQFDRRTEGPGRQGTARHLAA